MKVYYAFNGQGSGDSAICSTLEKAKEWLQESILKGDHTDPNPWEGWEWWTDKAGNHCFGVPSESMVAEGYVKMYEVI